jgi:hypothetical protein
MNNESLINTVKEVGESPFNAVQIYVGNPIKLIVPNFDLTDILECRNYIKESSKPIYTCIHGCLAYNLAGSVDGTNDKQYSYS